MLKLLFSIGVRKRLFLMGWVATIVIATPPILLFSYNKILAMFVAVVWSFPVLLIFYFLSKWHVTQPIETLSKELERIGNGDLSRKIDISLKVFGRQVYDEYYALNGSVNKMQQGLSSLVKLVDKLSETSHQLISVTMPLFFNLSTITEEVEGIKLPENIGDDVKNEMTKVITEIKTSIKDMEELSRKAEVLVSLSDELKAAAGMFKV